jgi:transposase
MTSVFNIEVKESPQKLKTLLNKQTKASKRYRLRALYLYSTGEIKSRRQMAAVLGRDESTIYRWLKTYTNEGLEG